MGNPIIETTDLSYSYPGGTMAIDQINTKICDGEIVAIIGQNGAGKSTFVKLLKGLIKPTEGKVLIEGKDTRDLKVSEIARTVGLVFQNPDHQIFADSVEKEISFGLKNIGLPPDEIEARVNKVLKEVGFEEYKNDYPRALGWGQRQRLAVASILAMKPKVLILDEPTTAHDYQESIEVMNLAKELHSSEQTTIIFITHNMSIVAKYAERVIVLCNGQVLLDDDTRTVFAQPDVLKKTFVRPPDIPFLFYSLGIKPLPLTVEEAYDTLLRELAKKSRKK